MGRGRSADGDLLVVGQRDLVGVVELVGVVGLLLVGDGEVDAHSSQGGQGSGGGDEVAAGKLAHGACPFKS